MQQLVSYAHNCISPATHRPTFSCSQSISHYIHYLLENTNVHTRLSWYFVHDTLVYVIWLCQNSLPPSQREAMRQQGSRGKRLVEAAGQQQQQGSSSNRAVAQQGSSSSKVVCTHLAQRLHQSGSLCQIVRALHQGRMAPEPTSQLKLQAFEIFWTLTSKHQQTSVRLSAHQDESHGRGS